MTGLSFSTKLVRLLSLAILLRVMLLMLMVPLAARMSLPAFASALSMCVLLAIYSGSRSKFVAGRPALIRRQVRELGINLLGVQEARTAAGARVVDGYVALASGADRGTLGCELWADTENLYASIDGKDYCFRQ